MLDRKANRQVGSKRENPSLGGPSPFFPSQCILETQEKSPDTYDYKSPQFLLSLVYVPLWKF